MGFKTWDMKKIFLLRIAGISNKKYSVAIALSIINYFISCTLLII